MIRLQKRIPAVVVTIIMATAGAAQDTPRDPAAAEALRVAVEKRSAEWEALAKGLDNKIARMLPCDPRVKESIDEVVQASDARLNALAEVMKSSLAQAAADVAKLQAAMAAEDGNLVDAQAERSEAMQERLAVDAQLADLSASARQRQSLEEARKVLADIDTKAATRAALADQQAQVRGALAFSLRDLLIVAQSRQRALTNEQAALAVETTRWNDYYAARVARAQVECTITTAPPSKNKKKSK
jgi:hypothetical protein